MPSIQNSEGLRACYECDAGRECTCPCEYCRRAQTARVRADPPDALACERCGQGLPCQCGAPIVNMGSFRISCSNCGQGLPCQCQAVEPATQPPHQFGANIHPTARVSTDARIHPTAIIEEYASVLSRAHIGANVRIGAGVVICHDALIGDSSTIGRSTGISHSVTIKPGTTIGEGCYIEANAIIGSDSHIMDFTRVPPRSIIGPGSTVNNTWFPSTDTDDDLYDGADVEYDDEDAGNNGSDEFAGVLGYGFRPTWEYRRMPYEQRPAAYYGIELEVESKRGKRPCDLVQATRDSELPHFWKSDGSINYGAELVFHPMTGAYLRANKGQMDDVLTAIDSAGGIADNTCGMHVHVSRRAFDGIHHVLKFLQFMVYSGRALSRLVSEREPGMLRQWAALMDGRMGQQNALRALIEKAKTGYDDNGRYTACNLTRYGTIEVRIFASTTDTFTFWKNIEFIDSVIAYTRETSRRALSTVEYASYLAKHRKEYKHIHKFLLKSNGVGDAHKTALKNKRGK